MRSRIRAALALALAAISPASLAPAAPASLSAPTANLDAAVSALRAIASMTADFTQTDNNGGEVTGVLTLKRPGRIRFQYQAGYPLLVLSDGAALSVIDTETKHLQRWPIGDSPLAALLDPSRDVSRYGRVLDTPNAGEVAIAVHDPKHPEYGTISLFFMRQPDAPGGLALTGWITLDAQNRRTLIRLAHQRYGMAASESLFRYRNPLAGPHP